MPIELRKRPNTYTVAVASTAIALLARAILLSTFGDRAPFFPFVLAVLASAWYGGFNPGMVATLLGGVLGSVLFVPPWKWIDQPGGALITALYVIVGATASGVCEALHRARLRTEQKQRELERVEAQLRDADQSKDQFLATLAHELRNPLAPIQNALELIRLKAPGDTDVREARDMIERQVRHLTRLVDDLLDVSRITREKVALRLELVALGTIVASAVEACQPLVAAKKHRIQVSLPEGPVVVDGDAVRLTQVLVNVINNAIKFTPPGGCIWLKVEREEREVLILVRDNGIGISPESLPHVFDLFVQGDQSLERSTSGLGIGLSLAHGLIQMHGGRIEARSEGVNQGSEFIIRLPLPQDANIVSQAANHPQRLPSRGRSILVVDDNYDAVNSLASTLRLKGHHIHTASDGVAAVEMATSNRPDVVLLDIGLPKLNGYDAARRIRQQASKKGIVLVALTGWGQPADKSRALEAGFDYHLTKPVDFTALDNLLAGLPASSAE